MSQTTIINFYNFHTNPPTHIRKAELTCNTASDQTLILPGCSTLLWESRILQKQELVQECSTGNLTLLFPPKSEGLWRSSNTSISYLVEFGFLNTFIHFWRTWPSVHTGPDVKPFVINRSLFSTDFNGSWTKPKEDKISQQVRVTHILRIEKKKKKRNNTKHLRCQSVQHSFVCVLLL